MIWFLLFVPIQYWSKSSSNKRFIYAFITVSCIQYKKWCLLLPFTHEIVISLLIHRQVWSGWRRAAAEHMGSLESLLFPSNFAASLAIVQYTQAAVASVFCCHVESSKQAGKWELCFLCRRFFSPLCRYRHKVIGWTLLSRVNIIIVAPIDCLIKLINHEAKATTSAYHLPRDSRSNWIGTPREEWNKNSTTAAADTINSAQERELERGAEPSQNKSHLSEWTLRPILHLLEHTVSSVHVRHDVRNMRGKHTNATMLRCGDTAIVPPSVQTAKPLFCWIHLADLRHYSYISEFIYLRQMMVKIKAIICDRQAQNPSFVNSWNKDTN